ncbi:hypothetical protein KC328_g17028, partial [Hortaea werneckii]
APVDVALRNYTNDGGWDTTGLAAMIGMVTPLNVLIGYDCTVHMAEELYDASITLPKAIMWSVTPNACLGILVIVTLAFCSGNIEEVLQTRTGEPFVQIFYNATGTKSLLQVGSFGLLPEIRVSQRPLGLNRLDKYDDGVPD